MNPQQALWIVSLTAAVFCALVGCIVSLTCRRKLAAKEREIATLRQQAEDFVHELASPISVLQSRCQLIDKHDGQTLDEDIEVLGQAVQRVSSMLDDMRTLTKAEDWERQSLELALIEINQMIATQVKMHQAALLSKGMNITQVRAKAAIVVGHRESLERVIANLLGNAIRYGKVGGNVLVQVRDEARDVRIVLEDDGPGIPSEQLPFVFDRFFRADLSNSSGTAGSGLGLAIVKSIVIAHKGDVTVESKPGRTAFTIRLPKVPPQHPLLSFIANSSTRILPT